MTDNTFPTLPLHPAGGCNETNTCTSHTTTTQLVQSFDGLQRSGNVATLGCCPTTPRQNSYRGRIGRHVRTYFIMPETQLHVTGSSTSPFGLSQRKSVITSLKFKKKKKRKYKKKVAKYVSSKFKSKMSPFLLMTLFSQSDFFFPGFLFTLAKMVIILLALNGIC